jgi:hypothetical protein
MGFVIIYFPKVAPHRSHAHLMICSFLFFFFIIVVFIPRPNYSMQCHVYTVYTLLYSNFFGNLRNKLLSVPSTWALARLPFLPTAQDFSFLTIQTQARSLLPLNKYIFSISNPMSVKYGGNMRQYRPGPDAAARSGMQQFSPSLRQTRHCRWAHMQGISLRSLFHLRPRPSLPPRRAL